MSVSPVQMLVYQPTNKASSANSTDDAPRRPFELVDASGGGDLKVRVVESLLVNQRPSGFSPGDDPPYVLDASGGDYVYACVTFNQSTGAFTSRSLGIGSSVPDDDGTTRYTQIGQVGDNGDGTLFCSNDQFGPIKAATYRKWFAYPKEYGFTWI